MRPIATREKYSSKFCFHGSTTMVSYVQKKNDCVLLLSTMHNDAIVSESFRNKPEIIEYYNETKSGVDQLDQKVKCFTTKRQSRRWPMAFFCNILDVAVNNSYILYTFKYPEENMSKRDYMKELCRQLMIPNMKRRLIVGKIQQNTRSAIQLCLPKEMVDTSATTSTAEHIEKSKRKRCVLCEPKDRKSSIICASCKKCVCGEHSSKLYICTVCNSK